MTQKEKIKKFPKNGKNRHKNKECKIYNKNESLNNINNKNHIDDLMKNDDNNIGKTNITIENTLNAFSKNENADNLCLNNKNSIISANTNDLTETLNNLKICKDNKYNELENK